MDGSRNDAYMVTLIERIFLPEILDLIVECVYTYELGERTEDKVSDLAHERRTLPCIEDAAQEEEPDALDLLKVLPEFLIIGRKSFDREDVYEDRRIERLFAGPSETVLDNIEKS